MVQLVGQACALCGERIGSVLTARFCPTCDRPAHTACVGDTSPIEGRCPTCHAPPPTPPPEPEATAPTSTPNPWAGLRLRQWACIASFIGFVPGICLLSFGLRGTGLVNLWADGIAGVIGMGLFGITMVWAYSFPCPRCGQPFGDYGWNRNPFLRSNPFARRCVHCRLRVGETAV